jgi:predicted ABC-type ATPase
MGSPVIQMTPEERAIADSAIAFARKNKKPIARRLTDRDRYPSEEQPVSVFMAGSPGAGKTEASIELLEEKPGAIRIDPDEFRGEFAEYTGGNSWLFQGAISILVDKTLDLALAQRQSFLLDGTLSRYDIAKRNIDRPLAKDRKVQILYVYQNPLLAWEFVQAREAQEGRRIPVEDFVNQYFSARDVVNRLKSELGKRISVDLLFKNNDNSSRWYKANVDQIDHHIPEQFSRQQLEQALT